MCHEVKKVEDTRKRVARKLPKSSCIFAHPFPFLVPFSLLYSLAPNPRSPISSENLPSKALYFHWWLRTGGCQARRSEGPGTRVEGKHGGRWHLGRELPLTPLRSASSYPHIQTCTKTPGLEELRGQLERHDLLETRGIKMGCWVL